MPLAPSTKRGLWTTFLVLVGILALTAIAPLTVRRMSSSMENLIGTVALFSGVALLILAGVANWQQPSGRIVAALGIAAALAALASTYVLIWYWAAFYNPQTGRYPLDLYAAVALSWTLAAACTLSGLISYARLPGALVFVRYATNLCIWGLSVIVLTAVVSPRYFVNEDVLVRYGFGTGIAALFGIIGVVVLHVMYAVKLPVQPPISASRVTLTCPGCGKSLDVALGESTCPHCRLRFRFEVEAPTCATCGYLLYQLTSEVCPECGSPVDSEGEGTPAGAPPAIGLPHSEQNAAVAPRRS